MEWSLVPTVFNVINTKYGPFDIDLFASSKNHKCYRYATFIQDHKAFAINAFSLT